MSKQKLVLPNYRVELKLARNAQLYNTYDKETINTALNLLQMIGVPVAADSREFDDNFPHIAWRGNESGEDRHISLTKGERSDPTYVETNLSSFMAHFIKKEPQLVKLRLTDDYVAIASADFVQVGCQRIPFNIVEELYNTMVKLKK